MTPSWRGIFPIVITPFTEGYELDEAGLRRVVRFCIEAGARGLVGPANASEFSTLSDDERKRWIEIVVSEAGGQVPVIAATTCGHALPAVDAEPLRPAEPAQRASCPCRPTSCTPMVRAATSTSRRCQPPSTFPS